VDVRFTGFRRESDENCARLGYYGASSGNFVPTLRDKTSVPSLPLSLENGTEIFTRKVGKSMCVGVSVWLVGAVSVWQAEVELQPATRIPPQPATPKLQHTSKQEHTTNVVIQQ